jgi:transcriptional regulator GlxA family with amidase domain
MVNISLWIDNGCLSSSIISLIDAFSIANICHQNFAAEPVPPLFETQIVSTEGKPVLAQGNVCLVPDISIHDVDRTDCVVISPLLPKTTPWPDDLDLLGQWLEKMKMQNTLIAAVCTGSFLLAQMGLLDGKKATTNWQYARLFKERFPRVRLVPEDILTEEDNIICTGAATAVNNLSLHLIGRYGSRKLAHACSKALLIDPNRAGQTPYAASIPFRSHGDMQVLKAQEFIESAYAQIKTIDDIALTVGISPRHFKRRFKKATGDPPLRYLQRVRIDRAKKWLETTHEPIDKVTGAVGYSDISSFSRLFKQHTRMSPKSYREKFFCQLY